MAPVKEDNCSHKGRVKRARRFGSRVRTEDNRRLRTRLGVCKRRFDVGYERSSSGRGGKVLPTSNDGDIMGH